MAGEGQERLALGPVLLLGAPGVGKGTQAQRLMDRFAIPQISTGDLLRQNVRQRTPLGVAVEGLLAEGKFVPDETVNAMVAARLQEPDTAAGFILDGYPRTTAQARWLDGYLEQFYPGVPLVAVEITLPEEELLRRITGRRTCPLCRKSYNVFFAPPAREGICDLDGSALEHRADDTESAYAERMREFAGKTADVITHYAGTGRFQTVRGDGSQHEVQDRVTEAIAGHRGGEGQGR